MPEEVEVVKEIIKEVKVVEVKEVIDEEYKSKYEELMKEYEQFKIEAKAAADKPPQIIEKIVIKEVYLDKNDSQKDKSSSLDLVSTDEYNQKV